jgi:hypothetical protein
MLTASVVQAGRPGGVAVLLPPFVPVGAPQPFLPAVSPFDVIGFMQSATVDTAADYFSAGWLEVDNMKIRVPRMTVFQMPATSMTWADMFINAPAGYKALGQSGLALSDGVVGSLTAPKPLTTYEVHVQGNRVVNPTAGTDQYVAGLIYIAQQAGTIGQGVINAIDYSTCATRLPAAPAGACMPDIWVGSTLHAKTGARIRLNTPGGRYGAPDALADARFTADEDNPTIIARTGYPMCAPRTDPAVANDSLCPQWNRPKDQFTGAYSVNYTFPSATAGAPDALGITHQVGYPTTLVHPDPYEQTPIEVGDYVSYIGNLIQDVTPCVAGLPMSSCQYVSVHTVAVELGLYTTPSTWPVYTSMSDFKFGVGGTPNPIFPQEAVEKIFGDFFTTDFSQLVDVYSEDVNSTTGVTSHRFYGSSDPFGPPLGGLKGRARFRVTIGNFLPPSRNMAVASRSLTGGAPIDTIINNPLVPVKLTANGLRAGFYTAPQFAYIFPENLVLGSPQIPLNFQGFPFLVNGSGPYVPFGSAPGTLSAGNIGQLAPWPSLDTPPAVANSTVGTLLQPPVASAGAPQTVASGATVTLSAAGSVDPNVPALPMIYTWQQLSGPAVVMQQVNNLQPTQTFVAPILAAGAAPVTLVIQLAVCNGFTCGGAVSTSVTVTSGAVAPPPAPALTLTASFVTNAVAKTTTVTLTASCGAAACPATLTIKQTNLPAVVLTGTGTTRTFTVSSVVSTTSATFVASLGVAGPTATVNVFDTITVLNVVYQLAHSKLQVGVNTTALPKGSAIITVTPLVSNRVSGADVVMTYDPVLDTYNVLADIVNPIPDGVNIRTNYGGVVLNSPVQRVR